MWSVDKCVYNIAKPAEGLVDHPSQSHFIQVLHEEFHGDWGKRQTHCHTISLLIELAIETAKGRGWDMA
jgi:hypothetical protein